MIISALRLTILLFLLFFMKFVSGGTPQLSDHQLKNASKEISFCQLATLRLGSEIADLFNSLSPQDYDTSDRIYQDFIVEHLGFAPWMSHGIRNTQKSLTGSSTEQLRERGGWNASAYDILKNKWSYMFGDSTTRQVWASYVSPVRQDGESFESNAKEWTRHNCEPQFPHRKKHSDHFSLEDRWEGPCHANEHSCHVTGYGERGRITFGWKHFPFKTTTNTSLIPQRDRGVRAIDLTSSQCRQVFTPAGTRTQSQASHTSSTRRTRPCSRNTKLTSSSSWELSDERLTQSHRITVT